MLTTCSRKLAGMGRREARNSKTLSLEEGKKRKKNAKRVAPPRGRIKDANAPPKFPLAVVFPPLCKGA